MYDTIKDVINSGRYELNDMLHKIDTLWVQGDLDDDQRDELVELARENATPEQTYAPIQEQIDQAFAQISALDTRIKALEAGGSEPTDPEPEDEWPEWVQPTGAHNAYSNGDKITYNGKHYISTMDGNVWSPDAYPAGWQVQE